MKKPLQIALERKICFHRKSIAGRAMRSKAITAINRLITARLEGNLRLLAAVGADRSEHLALRAGIAILRTERSTALRAASRLVLEALFRVESLLGSTEDEFLAAIAANESLVLIHSCILLKLINLQPIGTQPDFLMAARRRIQGGHVGDEITIV